MHFVYFILSVTGAAAVLTALLGGGFQLLHNYQTRQVERREGTPKDGAPA
jgi:hypothetical protein